VTKLLGRRTSLAPAAKGLVIQHLEVRVVNPPPPAQPAEREEPRPPAVPSGAWTTAARFYLGKL
jgi:hypothetical protein